MNKNFVKEFLKPEWKKGLIFVFLILITLVPDTSIMVIPASTFGAARGFPFIFYVSYGGGYRFNFLHLVLDLVILYLFSCLGVFLYKKRRPRRK